MKRVRIEEDRIYFYCPACRCEHFVVQKPILRQTCAPYWEFNNDYEEPTITPSVISSQHQGNYCHLLVENGTLYFIGHSQREFAQKRYYMRDYESPLPSKEKATPWVSTDAA